MLGCTAKRMIDKFGIKDIVALSTTAKTLRTVLIPAIQMWWHESDPNFPVHNKNNHELYFPASGSTIVCFSAESSEDSVRGGNYEAMLGDEMAFLTNIGIWDQAGLTLRRGISKEIVSTSPNATRKIVEIYNKFKAGDPSVDIISGTTMDNLDNLSDAMRERVESLRDSSLYRTEILGELVLENPASLWSIALIEENTVALDNLPKMEEYALGVDPAVLSKDSMGKKNGRTPDNTGLVLAGKGVDGNLYVIRDYSGSYSTEAMVKKVCDIYDANAGLAPMKIKFEINTISEENLKFYFKNMDRLDVWPNIKTTYSTQSKMQRASPYSLLTEQGKVKFVDSPNLDDLQMELTTYTGSGKSPDHMDAMVFALSALSPTRQSFTRSLELLF